MSAAVISLRDRGLDLVTSGGIRWIERVAGEYAACLLIRGPAGAGKTVFGLHVAEAVAEELTGAIAYACVEILPMELEAQVRSLRPNREDIDVRHKSTVGERLAGAVELHTRLLEIGDQADRLGAELERFWEELTAAGVAPKAVVIDSLISGSRLGSDVPRSIADAVCKLAIRWQVVLILLEECEPNAVSPWPYVADTVLELEQGTQDVASAMPSPFERRLSVKKHRFGASDPGPHRFTIQTGAGIRVFPRPSAWLEPWSTESRARTPVASEGTLHLPKNVEWPATDPLPKVVAIFGPGLHVVRQLAFDVKASASGEGVVSIDFEYGVPLGTKKISENSWYVGVFHPYLSAHQMLRVLLDHVEVASKEVGNVRFVRLGDLRALNSMWGPDGLLRALSVFCTLMRKGGIPVVLYETTPTRAQFVESRGTHYQFQPGSAPPRIVDLADVSIESLVEDDLAFSHARELLFVDRRTGNRSTSNRNTRPK